MTTLFFSVYINIRFFLNGLPLACTCSTPFIGVREWLWVCDFQSLSSATAPTPFFQCQFQFPFHPLQARSSPRPLPLPRGSFLFSAMLPLLLPFVVPCVCFLYFLFSRLIVAYLLLSLPCGCCFFIFLVIRCEKGNNRKELTNCCCCCSYFDCYCSSSITITISLSPFLPLSPALLLSPVSR